MKRPVILILGNLADASSNLQYILNQNGFDATETFHNNELFKYIKIRNPQNIIIKSCGKNTHDKLAIAQRLRHDFPQIPVILISRYSSEARAIAALRAGVADYFVEPFSGNELRASIQRTAAKYFPAVTSENGCCLDSDKDHLVGESPPIREVRQYIKKVAITNSNVFITGETGTGKELVAQLVHRQSARKEKPFICINCAALPDSLRKRWWLRSGTTFPP
jgi:DNA-binding NtrC family response regulator